MIQTIKKAWGIPELRKKIVFTALILLIFRIGNAIPVPYVDTADELEKMVDKKVWPFPTYGDMFFYED